MRMEVILATIEARLIIAGCVASPGGYAIATTIVHPLAELPLPGDAMSLATAMLSLLSSRHCLPRRGFYGSSVLDGSTPNHAVRDG